jgi:3D (Asp-Asp-Asp) domain-containing protein
MKKMVLKPRFYVLLLCVFIIVFTVILLFNNLNYNNKITEYQEKHKQFEEQVADMDKQIEEYEQGIKEQQKQLNEMITYNNELKEFNDKIKSSPIFKITSYDLSFKSCNKTLTSRGYGLTRTGFDLRGKDWRTARTIAVDKNVIPLGSRVYIKFIDEKYKDYNGCYMAWDTGSAINGNRIDLFQGDFESYYPHKNTVDFGITEAKVVVLD